MMNLRSNRDAKTSFGDRENAEIEKTKTSSILNQTQFAQKILLKHQCSNGLKFVNQKFVLIFTRRESRKRPFQKLCINSCEMCYDDRIFEEFLLDQTK